MLQELEIIASQLIEIQVTDASIKSLSFPQNLSRVEKGRITAIQSYKKSVLPYTPKGKPIIADAIFNASFLTLKNKETDNNDYEDVPLQDILRSNNNGMYERLKPIKVDFSQSRINIPDNITPVIGEVFILRIIYDPRPDKCAK